MRGKVIWGEKLGQKNWVEISFGIDGRRKWNKHIGWKVSTQIIILGDGMSVVALQN